MNKTASTCLTIVILASQGLAQTNVTGEVSGVWDKIGSPYVAIGDVIVPSGQSLTIEPGVEVKFDGSFKFEVNGFLSANGTEADSIRFTRNRDQNDSNWLGIQIVDADSTCKLSYCIIEYGENNGLSFRAGGGGLHVENSSAEVRHTVIRKNKAGRRGGGVFCSASSLTLDNVKIVNNEAAGSFGAVGGGGLYIVDSSEVTIVNCEIAFNSTNGHGGGIYGTDAIVNVFTSVIRDNSSFGTFSSADGNGGGIYIRDVGQVLFGNTFIIDNFASDDGGGVYSYNSTVTYFNVTVAGNSSDNGGAFYITNNSRHTINNSIIWGNQADFGARLRLVNESTVTINYSDGGNPSEGVGNIFSDPLFVDPENQNYNIQVASPSIDAGNPATIFNDTDGSRNDMGATGGSSLYTNFLSHDFGITAVGTVESVELKITNARDDDFNISNLTLGDATNFSVSNGGSSVIKPLASKTVQLTFQPQNADELSTELIVASNDFSGGNSESISLVGEGVAGSLVAGIVEGQWTIENGPYFVDGNLLVEQNDTLRIDAGVEVFFDGPYSFYVQGTLLAIGTADDVIRLTRRLPNEESRWQGLRFLGPGFGQPGTTSFLRYAIIEYANNQETFSEGGGMYCRKSSPILVNCTIAHNEARVGSGIFCDRDSEPLLLNVSITQNDGEGVHVGFGAKVTILNSIIWDNGRSSEPEIAVSSDGIADISYSNIEGGWDGEGNINSDPQFVDPSNNNFGLSLGSPSQDAGNPFPVYNDTDGSRNDMGAFGGSSIFVDALALDYGNIGLGDTKILALKFLNARESEITLESQALSDEVNFATTVTLPVVIPALAFFEFPVMFQPQAKGSFLANLAIFSNDFFGVDRIELSLQGSSLGTSVRGNVNGSWTKTGSPYIVVDEIVVAESDTLIVEPGVEVRFDGQFGLVVNGHLEAVGTESDSILFTRNRPIEDSKWKGIRFLNNMTSSKMEYCRIEYGKAVASPERMGGGIYCENSSVSIEHSLFQHNIAISGGGLAAVSGSFVRVRHIAFRENEAESLGGALYSDESQLMILDSEIMQNTGDVGGGCYFDDSDVRVLNTVVENNNARIMGGLECRGGKIVLRDILIIGNEATQREGGAIRLTGDAEVLVMNGLLTGNVGGGIYSISGELRMHNCTLADNSGISRGAAFFLFSRSSTFVRNSVIWGNTSEDGSVISGFSGAVFEIEYSIIQGGAIGEGNSGSDPQFVNPEAMNYRLSSASPAIDAAHPLEIFNDQDGTRGDMGFTGGSGLVPNLTEVDFGSFITGSSKEIDFAILNLRDEDFVIEDLSLSDTANFNVSGNLPITISPFKADTISVGFTPTISGDLESSLSIMSNDLFGATSANLRLAGKAENGTVVSGNATGVWSKNQSPFVVTRDVTVPDNQSLTIEPGVEIRFDGFYDFIVSGNLMAQGTSSDSIRFVSNQPVPQPGDWPGIRFNNNDALSVLKYCVVEYAVNGVKSLTSNDTTFLNIFNCRVANCSERGIFLMTDRDALANSDVSNTLILRNGGAGISCFADQTAGRWPTPFLGVINAKISKNFILNNGDEGIRCTADGTSFFSGGRSFRGASATDAEISFNLIANNRGYGIQCNASSGTLERADPLILNNTIYHNSSGGIQTGRVLSRDKFTIINNIVAYNGFDGIEARSDSIPQTNHNLVWGHFRDFDEFPEDYGKLTTVNNNQDSSDVFFNLNFDPLLLDPDNGDFRLAKDSPCIDAGDPSLLRDPDGSIRDMGALEATDIFVNVRELSESVPERFELFQNYPNPFNPETTIKYQLPKTTEIKLEIFNILGQRVATLVDKEQLAGLYSVKWNGKDNSGRSVASGIYLYQLKAEEFVKVRKLTMLR